MYLFIFFKWNNLFRICVRVIIYAIWVHGKVKCCFEYNIKLKKNIKYKADDGDQSHTQTRM